MCMTHVCIVVWFPGSSHSLILIEFLCEQISADKFNYSIYRSKVDLDIFRWFYMKSTCIGEVVHETFVKVRQMII